MAEISPTQVAEYSAAELRRRAAGKLWAPDRLQHVLRRAPARRSDYDLNPDWRPVEPTAPPRLAAVLVPVVDHRSRATVLLTRRTEHLPTHAGQIAFPGGKVEAQDRTPVDTALRESHEEIGLEPGLADVIGFLDPYETGTGFRILPVVAIIEPGFELTPDGTEVDHIFEVPLEFLMRAENHKRHSTVWNGVRRRYYAMPYGEHYIWGATAGMLRNLYEWLYN